MNSRPFSPTITIAIKIIEALISSEPEPDKLNRERLHWINEHTHEHLNIPISIVELAVFRNIDKGLNKEIEIYNKYYNLTYLYKILNEVSLELTVLCVDIAKKYSVDIPIFSSYNKASDIKI